MATISRDARGGGSRLGVRRLAATGALAAGAFYILCWAAAQVPGFTAATHMYLRLFATAEPSSLAALAQGLFWSVAFGLVAGALIALFYNALAVLDRG